VRLTEADLPTGTENLVLVDDTSSSQNDGIRSDLEQIDFDARSELNLRIGNWGFVRVWSL
jgi:hypothetical protein